MKKSKASLATSHLWITIVPLVLLAFSLFLPFLWRELIWGVLITWWAIGYYIYKVKPGGDLFHDGIWWVPYFIVSGWVVLFFSRKYEIIFNADSRGLIELLGFYGLLISGFYFWSWPPREKKGSGPVLVKWKRILSACLWAFFAALLWGYGTVRVMNALCDHSEVAVHDCYVSHKQIDSGRRYTHYVIYLEPLSGSGKQYSFYTSSNEYYWITPNKTIYRVWTREGFFHYQWIESIRKSNAEEKVYGI